jgi:transglutaminase/protease-like cytokinesis protein 3
MFNNISDWEFIASIQQQATSSTPIGDIVFNHLFTSQIILIKVTTNNSKWHKAGILKSLFNIPDELEFVAEVESKLITLNTPTICRFDTLNTTYKLKLQVPNYFTFVAIKVYEYTGST